MNLQTGDIVVIVIIVIIGYGITAQATPSNKPIPSHAIGLLALIGLGLWTMVALLWTMETGGYLLGINVKENLLLCLIIVVVLYVVLLAIVKNIARH